MYLCALLNGEEVFLFPAHLKVLVFPVLIIFYMHSEWEGEDFHMPIHIAPACITVLTAHLLDLCLSVPDLNDFNFYLHVCDFSVFAWMLNLWGKKSCLPSSFQSSDCCCFYETYLILALPKMSSVWIKDSSLVLSLINVAEMSWGPRMDDALSSSKKSPGNLTTNKQYKIECYSGKEMRSSARN